MDNLHIWYSISLFCDSTTRINIYKLCKNIHTGCKVKTDDVICLSKSTFAIKCEGKTIGPFVVNNKMDFVVMKKIIQIRKQLPDKNELNFDVIFGKVKRNYNWTTLHIPPNVGARRTIPGYNKIEIIVNKKIKYACVIRNEKVEITRPNNDYQNRILFRRTRSYQIYDGNKLYGKYTGDKAYEVSKKMCRKIFEKYNDDRNIINFSFMRKIDNKCFYYTR